MEKIVSRNPSTGEILQEIEATSTDRLQEIFARARAAQEKWAAIPLRRRARKLLDLREALIDHIDDLTALIAKENGKPPFEAITNDLLPSVELTTFFAKKGPKVLRDRKIRLTNPLVFHRRSDLNFWPLGVVAVISPWNFPFQLPFGEIVMAVISGNAVVFKPSEITPLIGLRIQQLFDEAGFPPDLLQTVIGDGKIGAAIIDQKPDKVFFTGSAETGKKIMAAAARHLIPVCLELGGKDAMIVLPDADLDYASSAALWGGFANGGQVCASTERILVHESVADDFLGRLKEKTEKLRLGPDLGSITMERQKDVYRRHLAQAREKGATFVTGGEFTEDQRALKPTVVTGPGIESLDVYNEETFGPVIAVTRYGSVAEAVRKANASRYGLLAAVITRNPDLGEEVARQLEVGTVTVNEVMYTAALPETPWGGLKESGFGRKHSELGLMEFVNVRHIHKPRFRRLVMKSLWWFPYTPYQLEAFRKLFELYRKSWIDKIRALPMFLWNVVQLMKNEPRL